MPSSNTACVQTIPQGLTDHGYTDQICVDFSPVLVKLMDARKADGVTWLCADVRDMPIIGSSSIDVAFDKGTLDAMIHGSPWDPPDEVKANSRRYMQEVSIRERHCMMEVSVLIDPGRTSSEGQWRLPLHHIPTSSFREAPAEPGPTMGNEH